ncbi:MAG: hypothetical protein KatS3mg122_0773 [Caldimonas sp.]|uniref:DUF6502 family protein n=1 Tax=Caldimonas manganoxidans TaxID=196015 RepID=UPI0003A05E44|nr:DUF6502 family protein [Caldimonas manganoxidans]GIX23542.1 MAG: hypothetical protein KatS3mg122_0773 [Caldimonas sp.]
MTSDPSPPTPPTPEQQALLQALTAVLEPLARLAVGRGLPYAAFEELAKSAFVRAAHAAHPDLPEHRRVSRISTTTGLSRREITRIVQTPERPPAPRSHASEVFARWMSDPQYRDASGHPLTLPRQGQAPSFESLAQSVTRDVHPRSLLEELVRLGLAVLDEPTDTVRLHREAFVPRGDLARMLHFLGDNVGDHLSGAVANVQGNGSRHFEQALFAEGLSDASMHAFRELVQTQWHSLRQALVPALQALLDADQSAGRSGTHRVRIGLYSYDAVQPLAPPPVPEKPKRPRGRPRKSMENP